MTLFSDDRYRSEARERYDPRSPRIVFMTLSLWPATFNCDTGLYRGSVPASGTTRIMWRVHLVRGLDADGYDKTRCV